MAKAGATTGRQNHQHLNSLNSSESSAQTQLANPWLLFTVLLLTHWLLTENVLHNGSGRFSGSLLCRFTQLERRLCYQKMTLWNQLKKGTMVNVASVWCPVSPETYFFILKTVRKWFKVVNDGEISFLYMRSCLYLTGTFAVIGCSFAANLKFDFPNPMLMESRVTFSNLPVPFWSFKEWGGEKSPNRSQLWSSGLLALATFMLILAS